MRVFVARSARCDVRWLPPSSSDLTERKSVVPPSPPADRRREHRESAVVVLRRAIADARSSEYRRYPVRRADSSAGVTNRYPTLRTVPMTDSYSGPSLARSRRTCTSTVRVPP